MKHRTAMANIEKRLGKADISGQGEIVILAGSEEERTAAIAEVTERTAGNKEGNIFIVRTDS